MPRGERRRRVEETAALLRIGHFLHRRVSGLAGGDRQRVALGRAIVRKPKAFLMDEPLGALDAEMRELMCGELRILHDRLNATTLPATAPVVRARSSCGEARTSACAVCSTAAIRGRGLCRCAGWPRTSGRCVLDGGVARPLALPVG